MNHKQKFYITKSLNWAAVAITNGAKIYIHFVVYGSQIIKKCYRSLFVNFQSCKL